MVDSAENTSADSGSTSQGSRLQAKPDIAAQDLMPLVYTELRRLATARMASQPPNHTLQATALVHEAYLRLQHSGREQWANRAHFFAAAAQAMRQILVENARRNRAVRHGGGQQRVEDIDLQNLPLFTAMEDEKILDVDEALELLQREDSIKAEVVKLRYFAGLNYQEIAEVLGLSEKTIRRYWADAKVWLFAQPSNMPTRRASFTATSNPPTSWLPCMATNQCPR